MTLLVVDVSRHQVERPDPLDLTRAKAAGFGAVNIQLDRGRQDDVLPPWARQYADRARELGMGISTYRWLDGRLPGAESARCVFARMREVGGPDGMAHAVDCEETPDKGPPATEAMWRDYVNAMQDKLQRPIAGYSGRWWWHRYGWAGAADLTPYLWSAPMTGYLGTYPGDNSPHWTADYGGWSALAAMQYAVTPLPGTGNCSLSAIRDPAVWAALTGGPMAWFVNRALTNFRSAVNAKYPRRDKGTDGTIGDAAHAGTSSDHNPDPDGSVDAWDMDVDLNGVGQPYAADVEALKAVFQAHEASQYWIHNGQIASRNSGWVRRPYTGSNRHDKHVHWNTRQSHENSNAPWVLEGDDMPLSNEDVMKIWTWDLQDGPGVGQAYQLMNKVVADVAAIKAAQAAPAQVSVDAADVAAALAGNAEFLSAVAKAVNDDAHARSAE